MIENMSHSFIHSLDRLDSVKEPSFTFASTFLKRLKYHLFSDQTLDKLMNKDGMLSLYLKKIATELEIRRMKTMSSNKC